MKIGGRDPRTMSNEVILVIPRGEEEIVFRAQGIPNYDAFNALCSEPKPPKINKPKEGWVDHIEEPGYKAMLETHGQKRMAWLVIESLAPTDIEWDTVDIDNPATWKNWSEDLTKSGFSQVECNRIQALVFEANCLDEEKLEKARRFFLRGLEEVSSESSGQSSEPETTPSGTPASA